MKRETGPHLGGTSRCLSHAPLRALTRTGYVAVRRNCQRRVCSTPGGRSPRHPSVTADPPPDDWQPNLSWITDHLAVGGSFPGERASHLAEALGIRAVVDLRSEERDDETLLTRHGITFLHLPTDDHHAVTAARLDEGVGFAVRHLARGERVLVHCEHGIGRSATLALCILVARGLTPMDALALAKDRRSLVSPSPAQHGCWSAWLASYRGTRPPGWEIPAFDAFASIAYRHLRRLA